MVALAVVGLLWACAYLLLMMQPSCQDQLEAAERRIVLLTQQLEAKPQVPPLPALPALPALPEPIAAAKIQQPLSLATQSLPRAAALRGTPQDGLVAPGAPSSGSGKKCLPKSTSSEDGGYADDFRGWYDVQSCGRCYDYCRWVGDSGPGGDPAQRMESDKSWWSCRLAGSSDARSSRGLFASWPFQKCAGEGAESQRPSGGAASALIVAPASAAGPPITEDMLKDAAARDAIAVVMIVCKRPQYLRRSMESLLKAQRDPMRFPVIISQDDYDPAMTQMVEATFVQQGVAFHMHHPHDLGAQAVAKQFGGSKSALGYVRIAQHFGFAMKRMFDEFGFQQVLFIEEDMEIAPDFFSYFGTMLPLLREDKDLFCVSAWNDNGYSSLVTDPKAAFRTDFFPGLGWMLTKSMWDEIRDRWAVAYWDEFMRRPDVRKSRHCIRPEVSRSYTFGAEGVSSGQFFNTHLSKIQLNSVAVDWGSQDLHYLASAPAFDEHLRSQLRIARRVQLNEVDAIAGSEALRIEYEDKTGYKAVAAKFSLMPDEKEGIRRMAYKGVIPFTWKGRRIFLHTAQWPGGLG